MSTTERKTFGAFEVKSEARGEVEAMVATLGVVDRDGDVFLPGSFRQPNRVHLSWWGHDVVLRDAPPVGIGAIAEQGGRAVFKGKFLLSTERGREAFAVVKELGPDARWSFGFPMADAETAELTPEWRAKGARRLYSSIEPIEASPVFRPAGYGTGTVAVRCHECGGGHDSATAAAASAAVADRPLDEAAFQRDLVRLRQEIGPMTAIQVDAGVDATAGELARWAAGRWGVEAPEVKWYPTGALPWAGCHVASKGEDGAIWIREDQDGAALREIVFHEVSHYARHARDLPNGEELVEGDVFALLKAHGERFTVAAHPAARMALWRGSRA